MCYRLCEAVGVRERGRIEFLGFLFPNLRSHCIPDKIVNNLLNACYKSFGSIYFVIHSFVVILSKTFHILHTFMYNRVLCASTHSSAIHVSNRTGSVCCHFNWFKSLQSRSACSSLGIQLVISASLLIT